MKERANKCMQNHFVKIVLQVVYFVDLEDNFLFFQEVPREQKDFDCIDVLPYQLDLLLKERLAGIYGEIKHISSLRHLKSFLSSRLSPLNPANVSHFPW